MSTAHKYHVGKTISACLSPWGNWGNGDWVYGTITNLVFNNGKPAYDIVDLYGNQVFNILEETIVDEE